MGKLSAAYEGYLRELKKNNDKNKRFLNGLDAAYKKQAMQKEFAKEFGAMDAATQEKIKAFVNKYT